MRARIEGRFAQWPDFELEAYLCGELPAARREALDRARDLDGALGAYLHEREQARLEFATAHPLRFDPRTVPAAAAHETPLPREHTGWSRRRGLAWASVATAPLLGLVLWWSSGAPDTVVRDTAVRGADGRTREPAEERDTIRIKGNGLVAELYVKRGQRVFRPRPDEALAAGDRVRLSVEAPSAGYLSVVGRDGGGAVSVYYDRVPVPRGRFTVPDSLQLDASPGDEVWLVVVAGEPHAADHYARALATGTPPDGAHALITLHKEEP
jgi:hypothetical protein